MILRQKYLDRLIAYQDTDLVKVVTGIRRCGKSTLLDMMRDHLARQGVPESRLLTFRMESMELSGIADYRELYDLVMRTPHRLVRSWQRNSALLSSPTLRI